MSTSGGRGRGGPLLAPPSLDTGIRKPGVGRGAALLTPSLDETAELRLPQRHLDVAALSSNHPPVPTSPAKLTSTPTSSSSSSVSSSSSASASSSQIICELCQRQFKSKEQLHKHEQSSELHKKNLEIEQIKSLTRAGLKHNARLLEEARPVQVHIEWECGKCASYNYSRRMDCYSCGNPRGSFETLLEDTTVMEQRAIKRPRLESRSEANPAAVPLDENNVGNKMLKKLGWKEGQGLGKDGTGIVEPIHAELLIPQAGLGSFDQSRRNAVIVGDSADTALRKKELARFERT